MANIFNFFREPALSVKFLGKVSTNNVTGRCLPSKSLEENLCAILKLEPPSLLLPHIHTFLPSFPYPLILPLASIVFSFFSSPLPPSFFTSYVLSHYWTLFFLFLSLSFPLSFSLSLFRSLFSLYFFGEIFFLQLVLSNLSIWLPSFLFMYAGLDLCASFSLLHVLLLLFSLSHSPLLSPFSFLLSLSCSSISLSLSFTLIFTFFFFFSLPIFFFLYSFSSSSSFT